jgi:hypothetical protein
MFFGAVPRSQPASRRMRQTVIETRARVMISLD